MIALLGQRSALRRLPWSWIQTKAKHGAGFRRFPADGTLHHWRLGFRQSSFRHITRASQRTVPHVSTRSPVSWHAVVPFTFQIQVSHQAQEPPFEFLPAMPGIRQGASWRTSIGPTIPASTGPGRRTGRRGPGRRSPGRSGRVAWSRARAPAPGISVGTGTTRPAAPVPAVWSCPYSRTPHLIPGCRLSRPAGVAGQRPSRRSRTNRRGVRGNSC